ADGFDRFTPARHDPAAGPAHAHDAVPGADARLRADEPRQRPVDRAGRQAQLDELGDPGGAPAVAVGGVGGNDRLRARDLRALATAASRACASAAGWLDLVDPLRHRHVVVRRRLVRLRLAAVGYGGSRGLLAPVAPAAGSPPALLLRRR